MTTPIFPEVDGTTGALPAFTEARYLSATAGALKAPLASPALTGTPTAPTAAAATSTTQVATTAFVQQEITAKAPLASPALTGNPTAPTQLAADDSTKVATTAHVHDVADPILAVQANFPYTQVCPADADLARPTVQAGQPVLWVKATAPSNGAIGDFHFKAAI